MTWTNPRTAKVGDLYTAPWYNAEVRDNLNWVVRPLAAPLTTTIDVTTTSETDVFGGAVTIPGGTLGTSGMVRATVLGDYLNNSGNTRTFTLKFKLGGTELYNDVTNTLASSANRHDWVCEFCISLKTSVIYLGGVWHYSTAGGATSGIGAMSSTGTAPAGPSVIPFGSNGTPAMDMSVDRLLEMTFTSSGASTSFRRHYAIFELVGQGA